MNSLALLYVLSLVLACGLGALVAKWLWLSPVSLDNPLTEPLPGSADRPLGNDIYFLEDIKARGFVPDGIIDVGAHRGYWSKIARQVFPSTKFLLIEIRKESEQDLKLFCRNQPGSSYVLTGVGNKKSKMALTVQEELDRGESTLCQEKSKALINAGKQRMVSIDTIDNIIKRKSFYHKSLLVKMDIQGFELEALKGGTKVLKNCDF